MWPGQALEAELWFMDGSGAPLWPPKTYVTLGMVHARWVQDMPGFGVTPRVCHTVHLWWLWGYHNCSSWHLHNRGIDSTWWPQATAGGSAARLAPGGLETPQGRVHPGWDHRPRPHTLSPSLTSGGIDEALVSPQMPRPWRTGRLTWPR